MTDSEILRRAAAIFRERGDRSEPARLVPTWLECCAVQIEIADTPTSAGQAARNADYDDARAVRGAALDPPPAEARP